MTGAEKYTRIQDLIASKPDIFEGLLIVHRDKFLEWLPYNLHVISAFGKYAIMLKEKGNREYYSAYCIRERLRWDSLLTEVGTEYKISNNVTPFVARLIMAMDHRLVGLFRTKGNSNQMSEFEAEFKQMEGPQVDNGMYHD